MRIIRPVSVTDAILLGSDVPENDYATYDSGTTYAATDRVISTATHHIYESQQASNTGHALTDDAWWLDVGPTNRWRMFDGGVATQTQQADSIEVVLSPGRIDSVALLNISASTYRVMLAADADSPTDIVYDTGDVSVDQTAVGDWYQYFFEEIAAVSDITLTDLPPYNDGVLTVLLRAPGGVAGLGILLVGCYRDIGDMQWAPRIGIIDYSVKEVDVFGNASITERAFSKRMSCDVFIDNALIDGVVQLMTRFRATPVVWIGDPQFTSTIVYGWAATFEAVISSPAGSFYNLDIEGLI